MDEHFFYSKLVELGVAGVMLAAFVWYAWKQDKAKDERIKGQDQTIENLNSLRVEDAKILIPVAHDVIANQKNLIDVLDKMSKKMPYDVRIVIQDSIKVTEQTSKDTLRAVERIERVVGNK